MTGDEPMLQWENKWKNETKGWELGEMDMYKHKVTRKRGKMTVCEWSRIIYHYEKFNIG